ncbi:hypothetical protein CPB83DRAFT_859513 [Crepidotus variabilis]|uniref:Uncharacterized protein n=1 Tax=Crepidotus variabilis TaxID=179855 RepID=A0A9P6JM10_9AGAR|nr:hypothetical protein CPB83DRAFT_859513 [Crepidotus variabilis]
MDSLTMPVLDPENDPWRRGIERPNAKRLSISLGPLVAQRSLLFRIKADLAGAGAGAGRKIESYEELEESEVSPPDSTRLYSYTPGASGNIFSSESIVSLINASQAAPFLPSLRTQDPTEFTLSPSSAVSTASIYSQASWNPVSASISSAKPRDRRRQAVAFSPSLRWDGIPSSASRLPASLMSASMSLAQKPDINSPSSLSTRKAIVATPQPPTPLSPLLKMDVLESGANANEVVGSIRLLKASPTPLVAVRRRVKPVESDEKWRPQRQLSITNPPVTEERMLHDQSTVEPASHSLPLDEEPINVLKKKPSQDENNDSKRRTKRVTRFSKVMNRFSVASKKDKHISKDVRRRAVGSGMANPTEIKLVLLPEVEMSPTDLSFSESLAPGRPAPVWPGASSPLQNEAIAAIPPSTIALSTKTPYRMPPRTQPLPSLPPLPTLTHSRPLLPVHEAPPSTPARTPFAAGFDEEDLVALQGQRAQATRVHRRSRSSSAILRTPGPQDVHTHPLPEISDQVPASRNSKLPGGTAPAQHQSNLNETSSCRKSSMRPPAPPPPRPPRALRPPSAAVNANSGDTDGKRNSNVDFFLSPMPSLPSGFTTHLPVDQRLHPSSTHVPPWKPSPRTRNHSLSTLPSKSDMSMRTRPRVPSAAEPFVPIRR